MNVMTDKHISATSGVAGALWVVGLGLMIAGVIDLRFMGWGLWLSGVGAILTVRRMLCAHHGLLHDAFEMGREVGHEAAVRSLK